MVHTKNSFIDWLRRARPGERLVYHIGNLMVDRTCLRLTDEKGAAAWSAMEAGKVHLHVKGGDYIAIKRAPPYDPVKWVGCYDRKRKNYNKSVKEVA